MEYWSVEKKDINSSVITPILQYSNTPKLIEIESYQDGLPSFDYRSVNNQFFLLLGCGLTFCSIFHAGVITLDPTAR